MSRILVTGGAGFIGSHVVEEFIEAGHEVAVLDNLSSGKRENLHENARFFEGSINDKSFVDGVLAEFTPEVIDHHAAQVSVGVSVADPARDAHQNVMGLINVLESAKNHGVKKFIMISSAAIYGDNQDIPLNEDAPFSPLSPYAITKYIGEHYVRFYSNQHGLESVIFRYANAYGPRQNPHGEAGVIAIFTNKAIAGETYKIFGNGEQTRDFVYVKDIAHANLLAINGKSGTYNVSTGEEITINRVVEEFQNLSGNSFKVLRLEPRPGDIFRSALDSTRIRETLGWEPEVTLSKGLKETYFWYRNHNEQEDQG